MTLTVIYLKRLCQYIKKLIFFSPGTVSIKFHYHELFFLERDLIGIDEQTNRLVFLASASDFEEKFTLPLSLLNKHTKIKMHSNLIDSHVYVLKNWVIKYLKHEDSLTSLKGELLPHIVKKQLAKPPKTIDTNQSILTMKDPGDIFALAKEDALESTIRELSSFNDHTGDLKEAYHGDVVRCFAYVAPKGSFGVRVNTLQAYWSTNARVSIF